MSMVDINKKLHEFKDRHYFAKNMTLAVQSQEELDTLEAWVKESFGNVPDGGGAERESFSHLKDPFDTEDFRQVYKVAPIQNVYQVDLNWALPPMLDKYRCKPLHYLSWIIGHEGEKRRDICSMVQCLLIYFSTVNFERLGQSALAEIVQVVVDGENACS